MGRIIYGGATPNELDDALEAHGLGTAGGTFTLEELPEVLRELAPLWWEHNDADYGRIFLKGGFMGDAETPFIDREAHFTAMATTGIRTYRERMTGDHARLKRYGPSHAYLLHLTFRFSAFEAPHAREEMFADTSHRTVPAGSKTVHLTLSRTPTWSPADHFGLNGRDDNRARLTSVGYIEQATAMSKGWREAHIIATSGR